MKIIAPKILVSQTASPSLETPSVVSKITNRYSHLSIILPILLFSVPVAAHDGHHAFGVTQWLGHAVSSVFHLGVLLLLVVFAATCHKTVVPVFKKLARNRKKTSGYTIADQESCGRSMERIPVKNNTKR